MAPRLVIFDLDNCLYHEPPELSRACEIAMAKAISELVPGLSFEEALELSIRSNHLTGSVRTLFAEKFDIDQNEIHQRFHNYVDHLILPVCEDTRAAFKKIRREKTLLGLLTHGSRGWTDRVLFHLGLNEYFHPALVIPTEEVGFQPKHESEAPFLHLIERAKKELDEEINPAEAMMVEDVALNLVPPHRMGMKTVLVHHGRPPEKAAHIDYHCENVGEVIARFLS